MLQKLFKYSITIILTIMIATTAFAATNNCSYLKGIYDGKVTLNNGQVMEGSLTLYFNQDNTFDRGVFYIPEFHEMYTITNLTCPDTKNSGHFGFDIGAHPQLIDTAYINRNNITFHFTHPYFGTIEPAEFSGER